MVNTKILAIGIGIVIVIILLAASLAVTTNFDSQFLNDNANLIQQNANSADLIFAGKIVSIGTPPIDWSGKYELSQKVKYEVSNTIKGTYTNSIIEVNYLIVKGAAFT